MAQKKNSRRRFGDGTPGPGRPKGLPNKVTTEVRQLLRMAYERRLEDLDRWIRETGDGYKIRKRCKCGNEFNLIGFKDPGKAAEILVKLADHFVPRLQRVSIDLSDIPLEEIEAEVARREANGHAAGMGPTLQ